MEDRWRLRNNGIDIPRPIPLALARPLQNLKSEISNLKSLTRPANPRAGTMRSMVGRGAFP
jgi:hypothetical protein